MASSDDGTSAIHHRKAPQKRGKKTFCEWMKASRKAKKMKCTFIWTPKNKEDHFKYLGPPVPLCMCTGWGGTKHSIKTSHGPTLNLHITLGTIKRTQLYKYISHYTYSGSTAWSTVTARGKKKSKVAAQKQLIFIVIQPLCAYSTPQVTWSRTIHILTSGWSLAALSWNKQMLWIYCVLPLHSICILNSHKTC